MVLQGITIPYKELLANSFRKELSCKLYNQTDNNAMFMQTNCHSTSIIRNTNKLYPNECDHAYGVSIK